MESEKIILKKSWEYYLKKLGKFKTDFGHCNVPYLWENDPELAYWTEVQRTSRINLSKAHFNLLNQLGFDWKFEDLSWEAMYKRFVYYYNTHQHVKIPPDDRENDKLRQWILHQKWNFSNLGSQKQQLLEPYLHSFQELSVRRQVWEERIAQLQEFILEFGHCRVPQLYKPNLPLARWVHNNRKRPQHLSEDRIQQLKEMGFEFGRLEPTWEEMYQELLDFKKQSGHTSPSRITHVVLQRWVVAQRLLFNRKKLLPERRKQLEKIGFDWHPMQSKWLKQFEGYKKLFIDYNKKIPYKVIIETKYDHWIYMQRVYFEKNKLSQAQLKLLASVKINLIRKPVSAWDVMFEQLKAFNTKFGHFQIFKREIIKEHKKLAAWTDMQRKRKKQGALSEERIAKLDSIQFTWDGDANYNRKGIPRPKYNWMNTDERL